MSESTDYSVGHLTTIFRSIRKDRIKGILALGQCATGKRKVILRNTVLSWYDEWKVTCWGFRVESQKLSELFGEAKYLLLHAGIERRTLGHPTIS